MISGQTEGKEHKRITSIVSIMSYNVKLGRLKRITFLNLKLEKETPESNFLRHKKWL